jgi:hypothetical protein
MPADLVDRINATIAAEHSYRQQGAVVVPLAPRRRAWLRAGMAAAAVAAVAVAVPALMSTWGPGGGDTASSFSSREAASDSAAGSGVEPPLGSFTSSPSVAQDRASKPLGDVRVQASGTAYTAAGLATQARTLTDTTTKATAPAASLAAAGASAAQLRECLTALGVDTWAPVAGDLATFEGEPAIVAVVSTDTGQSVYAVSTHCRAAHPLVLSGPVALP